jgi:superfamily I DNA/RNA helicase
MTKKAKHITACTTTTTTLTSFHRFQDLPNESRAIKPANLIVLDPTKQTQQYSKFQRRAVTPSPFTNVIIRAGPGTGKTTTLRWRIQNFVQRGIDPRSILALSFTREAQEGLKRQVNIEMKWKDSRRPTFKTFHSLAYMVLKAVSTEIPVCQFNRAIPSFDIISDSESCVFVAEAIQQFNEKEAVKHGLERLNLNIRPSSNVEIHGVDIDENITSTVLNTFGGGGGGGNHTSRNNNRANNCSKHKRRNFNRNLPTDGEYVVGMKKWIRAQKNHGITAAKLMSDKSWERSSSSLSSTSSSSSSSNDISSQHDNACKKRHRCALIYSKYQELLEQHAYLDIEDLCPGFLSVLRTSRSVVTQLQSWARFILVDEFQDLNQTQIDILKHLCGGGSTSSTKTFSTLSSYLTICGDPDQSIYGFRGALGIRGFQMIENLFKEQKEQHQREMLKCELLENRRSLPPIVNASNALISYNYTESSTAGKLGHSALHMTTMMARKHFKGIVKPLTNKNIHMEVKFIVETIERLKNDTKTKYKFKDFCVLSRTNVGLKLYEDALSAKDIPWKLVGTSRTSETAARKARGTSFNRTKKETHRSGRSAIDHGVSLSTIHQAKGNEWSVVFVVHSTEGMMPMDSTGEYLEEERRIYYVAMTRAKEMLYMSWHHEGCHSVNDPSRFMEETGAVL